MNVRQILLSMFLLMFMALPFSADKNEKSARELATRIMGEVAKNIRFEQLLKEKKLDIFELETIDGKVVIRGDTAILMAVGLNHYLKYYCKTSVSWNLVDPIFFWEPVWVSKKKKPCKFLSYKAFRLSFVVPPATESQFVWRYLSASYIFLTMLIP